MAKYDALTEYLRQQSRDRVEMTFDQVGHIVDGLPRSAYDYRPWWANSDAVTNVHSRGWLAAGWRVDAVNLTTERVTFARGLGPLAAEPALSRRLQRMGSEAPEDRLELKVARQERVEAAARLIRDSALTRAGSAFTPGRSVWSSSPADELKRLFSDRVDLSKDSFDNKLRRQLEGASDAGYQLMAELLYLNVLPLSDYRGDTKRTVVNTVLALMREPARVPAQLDAALDSGVFNGGVAFKTGRWQQLLFLIEFVRTWTSLSDGDRAAALRDPWQFRDLIQSTGGARVPAQRFALQYLIFPEVFQPIVSTEHRARIRDAYLDILEEPTGDVDRDLLAIREVLVGENGATVDFYLPPWSGRWQQPVRRGWLVRGSAVNGVNVVPAWLAGEYVSVAATHLRRVEPGLPHADLQAAVEDDYHHASYSARNDLVAEFDAFLNKMQEGDTVITASGGAVYLGVVSGPAAYVESPDGRSNLRRPVEWANAETPLDSGDLPAPLPSRLSNQRTIVDLTADLELLDSLIPPEVEPPPPPPDRELHLTPATDELADRLLVGRDWLQETIDLLRDRKQLIFYGPPGTGKTFLAQHIAWHLTERSNVALVQFHPAYSYEDFFEGFRPSPTAEGSGVAFTLTPGPFRRLVDAARANPLVPHLLIVDEINRANLAKVFGELYFLLEYRDQPIRLLYSGSGEDDFTLPDNVFLIGTMNTADRSIALVDAAMRRRFAFLELHPSMPPVDGLLSRWLRRVDHDNEPAELLAALNSRISNRDFQIGPSYLMRPEVYRPAGLERTWRTAILPLLEEYHYGDGTDVARKYGLAALRKSIAPPAGEQ